MADTLATLIVKLVADTGELVTGVNKAGASLDRLEGFAARAKTALTNAFTVTAIAAAAQRVSQFAGEITDTAKRLDITTDAVQRLSFAATQNGVSMGTIVTAIETFNKKVANDDDSATGAVGRLGLSMDRLKAASPDQAFLTLAKSVANVGDRFERTKLETDLWGKAGTQVGQIADKLSEDMDRAAVAHKRLIDAGDELGDSIDSVKTSGTGLIAYFLLPLSKSLGLVETAIGGVLRGVTAMQTAFGGDAEGTAGALKQAQTGMDALLEKLTTAGKPVALEEADRIAKELNESLKRSNAELDRMKGIEDGLIGVDLIKRAEDFLTAIRNLDAQGAQPMKSSWGEIVTAMETAMRAMEETGRAGSRMYGELEAARNRFSGLKLDGTLPSTNLGIGLTQAPTVAVSPEASDALRRARDTIAEDTEMKRRAEEYTRSLTEGLVIVGETADQTKARLDSQNAAMKDGLLIVGQTAAAHRQAGDAGVDAYDRVTHSVKRMAEAFQIAVPRDFSWERAYRDAGLFVHDSPFLREAGATPPTVAASVRQSGGGPGGGNVIHIDARESMFDTPEGVARTADKVGQAVISRQRASGVRVR